MDTYLVIVGSLHVSTSKTTAHSVSVYSKRVLNCAGV